MILTGEGQQTLTPPDVTVDVSLVVIASEFINKYYALEDCLNKSTNIEILMRLP